MKKNHIYNKVKGLTCCSILSLCSTFLLSGCNDFLEIEPQDKIILEKFWSEKSDVDNVLVSCYSAMQSDNMISRMMVWGEFRSDNVGIPSGMDLSTKDVSLERVLKENIDATNAYTGWNEFYGVINRCNTVLMYAPEVAAKDPAYTDSELKATIAEAKAIRALCYFYLIRTFRNVPFVTEAYIDDSQKMDIDVTSFDDILDYLIQDLESVQDDAVRRYPSTTKTKALYNTGRITQCAIHAMLCEMYLWKQDYANCVKYADKVIDFKKADYDAKYAGRNIDQDNRLNGFPLTLDWYGNASVYFGRGYTSIFGTGSDDESIFELVFMEDDNMLANGPVNTFYGNGTDLQGFVSPSSYIGNDVEDEKWVVFHNKYDSRYYESIYRKGNKEYRIAKYMYQSVTVDVKNATKPDVLHTLTYAKDKCHANWIIYRLPDIMLMKAEALVEQISDANVATENDNLSKQAFTLVNAINKRSLCQTVMTDTLPYKDFRSKSKLQELVMQERQRELLFEGKRWYDLVRYSLRKNNAKYLSDHMIQKGLENSSLVANRMTKIDAIFWPYNQEECKVNPNLARRQNPSYPDPESGSIQNTSN